MLIINHHSTQNPPLVDLLFDESVELVCAYGASSVSPNRVDQLFQLLVRVTVPQLVTDVSHVLHVQLALALDVQQGKGGSPAFLTERVSLSYRMSTILAVSSRRKPSKSRASEPTPSQISDRAR